MYFTVAVLLSVCSAALARPVRFQRRVAALDTGSCGSPQIEFANGLDGRTEPAFQPLNQQDFDHGSAQKIGIIADFVCGQLQSKCKASADTVAACDQGKQASAQATGGAAADAFNAALGITSNFAAGAADGAAASGGNAAVIGANATATDSTANTAADANSTATTDNSTAAEAALDTGSCGSPEIQFADGLDGRKEPSFQAVNQQDFNHGSALNIGVIADFVCGQLQNKCKASAETVAACDTATQDAAGATGGAAADAFNAALGITSNFAAGAADGAATAGGSNATATDTGSNDTTATTSSTAAAAAATNAAAASGTAATGDNLQAFAGALGATPPAVTASGDDTFQVDGNASFNNLQNALVRDVQHNQCANAANASGNKGDLTVAACGTQQEECNAEAQSSAAA